MGGSQRKNHFVGSSKANPGPGNYTVKSMIGEGPKFALRPKTATVRPDGNPGPGQYAAAEVPLKSKAPAAVIGTEVQHSVVLAGNPQAPGPGAYSSPLMAGKTPAYRCAERTESVASAAPDVKASRATFRVLVPMRRPRMSVSCPNTRRPVLRSPCNTLTDH